MLSKGDFLKFCLIMESTDMPLPCHADPTLKNYAKTKQQYYAQCVYNKSSISLGSLNSLRAPYWP